MVAHGAHSIDEIYYRAYMVWANLWEQHGRIRRSPAYDALDPTEKGAISYFLGMTIAKLISDRLFHAPWMVHLDRLVDYQAVGLVGRSRPDLAGIDSRGRWLVLEGKGRTGGYSKPTMDQAKSQVQQVRTIDGAPPYLRVGCQTYFDPSLSITIVDPEDPLEESSDLEIGLPLLQGAYYKRFGSVRERRTRSLDLAGTRHDVLDIEELGVCVGIAEGAESRIASAGVDERAGEVATDAHSTSEDDKYVYRVFSDGLSVGLSDQWSAGAMSLIPNAR